MRTKSILMIATLLLAGCKSASSVTKPGYDFQAARKVAVIEVTGAGTREAARNEINDLFGKELLQHGFDVITRIQVQALFKEQDFQASGKTGGMDPVKAGQILNVQAVVIVNVPQYGEEISMTATMVDAQTGSLLWSSEGSGRTGSTAATVAGALVGGVAGGFAGSRVGSDAGTGTKVGAGVGAAAGGLAAHALSDTEAQTLRDIIGKMGKGMPDLVKKP